MDDVEIEKLDAFAYDFLDGAITVDEMVAFLKLVVPPELRGEVETSFAVAEELLEHERNEHPAWHAIQTLTLQ